MRTAGNPGDFSTPSQFTFHSTTKDWELDALGNWLALHASPNASETYQSHETREYNQANELIERDAGSGALELEYDHAGNISYKPLSSNAGHNFYHDAWNRLVRVEYAEISPPATVDLIENSYYGTGWRATKKSDRSVPLDGDLEHARTMFYDADWRLVYEEIDDDFISSPSSLTRKIEYHHGLRGLNDILLKRASTTLNNDSPNMTFEQVRYYATVSQFSVRAVVGENAQVIERVSYDAYGNARHHRPGDIVPNTVGEHGGTDVFDQFALQSNWNNFGVGDLDRSGVVDVFDLFIVLGDTGAAEPAGNITLPAEDNIHGYTGGVFDAEAQIYLFRNRYYDPSLGRFLQRDPLGYVDGMNLYLYGLSNPLMFMDPLGLWGYWDNFCDGFLGFFGGSPIDRWTDNRDAVQANQEAIAERQVDEGKMSQAEADALMAANQASYDAIDSAVTDVHQAQMEVLAAILSLLPGGQPLAIGLTAGSVGIDISQGQYAQAALNVVPGAGGEVLAKGASKLLGSALKAGADDVAEAAASSMAKGNLGESVARETLEAQGHTIRGRNVTLDAPDGTTIRADLVTEGPNGRLNLVEAKNGPNARYSPNQSVAYPQAGQHGWVGRGSRAEGAGLPVGEQTGPFGFISFWFNFNP